MHCNDWNSVSYILWWSLLLKVCGLILHILSWQNSYDVNFLRTMQYAKGFPCLMLLCYLWSSTWQALAGKCSWVQGHIVWNLIMHLQFFPSPTCSNPAARLMPDASVSRYRGLDTSENFIQASCLIIFLVLSYRSCYILFHDYSAVTDVIFCSGSQTSAVVQWKPT